MQDENITIEQLILDISKNPAIIMKYYGGAKELAETLEDFTGEQITVLSVYSWNRRHEIPLNRAIDIVRLERSTQKLDDLKEVILNGTRAART